MYPKNDLGPQVILHKPETGPKLRIYAYWLYLSFIGAAIEVCFALIQKEGKGADGALVTTRLLFQSSQSPLEASIKQDKKRQSFEMAIILCL